MHYLIAGTLKVDFEIQHVPVIHNLSANATGEITRLTDVSILDCIVLCLSPTKTCVAK